MKMWAIVFFLLPLLGAGYVSWRTWQILPLAPIVKGSLIILFWLGLVVMVLSFIVGLDSVSLPLARILYEIGNSWIFILLYLFMLFLVLDFGCLIHLIPHSLMKSSIVGSLIVVCLMLVFFVYGNVHYYNKVRVPLSLKSSKPLTKPLKIVMISDLHLGYHNSRNEFAKWVDKLNAEQPDLILIAGDVIDISIRPLIEEGTAEEFRRLKAPIYACLGNHEYYSGEPLAQKFFDEAKIKLLRDKAVVDNDICIVGRDDRTNPLRMSVRKLMQQADTSKYIILLDHQPYHLELAERAGVDFLFSGHTHHGQVWPISWITDAIYECAYGTHQRGNTQYYVSSGIGIWGGKFRIGTQSEYVVATLE